MLYVQLDCKSVIAGLVTDMVIGFYHTALSAVTVPWSRKQEWLWRWHHPLLEKNLPVALVFVLPVAREPALLLRRYNYFVAIARF